MSRDLVGASSTPLHAVPFADDRRLPSMALPLALAAVPVIVAIPAALWVAVVGAAALGVGAVVAQSRRDGLLGLPRSVVAATD